MQESGQIISRIRRERGLTQGQLARRAAIPQSNLSNIEIGKRDLTVSTLRRIALALEVSAARLLEEPLKKGVSAGLFTRSRVEKIARAVVTGEGALSVFETELVSLLRYLAPETARGRFSSRKAEMAWSRLKVMISPTEIKTILQKVRDAAQRQA